MVNDLLSRRTNSPRIRRYSNPDSGGEIQTPGKLGSKKMWEKRPEGGRR